tara:strand:- start:1020 stop:2258 length:1239 start_codon:yes stop_codon:yes gene_type:complete
MPFLGNKPTNNFTSFEKQDITGSGTTSYTLAHAVNNEKDIDLYINHVHQEPTTAYSASGTTLTLTESISSSDDCYILFRSRAIQSATPPDGSVNSAKLATDIAISGDLTVDTTTLKVDSSNNRIGLGTASPTAQLHIVGDDTSNQVIIENTATSASSAPDLMLLRTSTSSAADNDVIGRIDFAGLNDANEQINYFTISARIDDASDGTENGQLRLQHIKDGSYVEPVVIDGTGGLRVGLDTNIFNTAASEKASIKNTTTGNALTLQATDVTGGYPILWLYSSDSTASQNAITFQRSGGGVGTITTSASSTAYNTSSDYRLKESINYSWDATSRLKQLKPSRFNFKVDKDTTVDGFLAHEVSSIVPEAITGEKDAVDKDGKPIMQGIDQSKLVPLLVKTIQELEARITALEGK